jgi:hypothetical protein
MAFGLQALSGVALLHDPLPSEAHALSSALPPEPAAETLFVDPTSDT